MASEAQAHNGKAQGSRGQHRRNARSGQGIIEANRKTAICKHWLQGVCPFGARCAFAHGAKELRNATTKSSPPPEMGMAKHLQSPPSRDATTSCSDQRCMVHPGAFSDGESRLLEAKSPVTDQGSLDEGGHGHHRGVWFETRRQAAGNNDGCERLPLREIGTNNQPRAQDGDSFSLWQSPNTILRSPIPSLDWAGSNTDHHHHNNTPPGRTTSGQPYLRGALRENETWAKIAQGKPTHGRESNGARAPNATTATTITTPSVFHRDEHRRDLFRETKAQVAGSASSCSSGVICCCRARSNRATLAAVSCDASVGPEPTLSTTGLTFRPRGCSSPAPLALAPPSAPSSQQHASAAASAAAHRWNPITYNSSAVGDSFAASSLKEISEARESSPAPAPIDLRYRHEMDEILGRMMSVLSLDVSRSNDDASRDVGTSVPQAWYGPDLLQPVENEPARLKTAHQPGGSSGDSSRLDQSYRNNSLGKSAAPDRNSKSTSTSALDAFNVPSVAPILDEKWQTVLPTWGSLKDGFSEASTTETNRSASPSPFGWGLEPSSMAPSAQVPNDALTNPGGRFSHSLW